ncbi:hypothetical protein E2C01_097592 [Portunus trituberculatus]|uniref:Uncharacterized protein n=1 Tax=Portunus trituberculatus TaxID=210409 RepID=A0A5B7K630_PORTR|nr:hypothetical protein [Portunus trituberculatus]
MQPNQVQFPKEQQPRSSTPSWPNQQQTSYSKKAGGTTPRAKTIEHPEQPSHASPHCARTQEPRVSTSAKDWLVTDAMPARPARGPWLEAAIQHRIMRN